MRALTHCAIGFAVLLFTGSSWAATTVTVGTDPTRFVIKGTIVTPDQVIDGEVVIECDTITCVAASSTDPPDATRVTVTNAYILPGFVDAHNHV
jgi:5-methylthioadenosine/S-adenosylhomocysteine deaminase